MDRAQFMAQLKRLLSDISEAERQEALDYYESYFDDAGPENEAAVIRELGSPGKVAAIIKADLSEGSDQYGEYTERGYEDTRTAKEQQLPDQYTEITVHTSAGSGSREEGYAGRGTGSNASGTGNASGDRVFGRARARQNRGTYYRDSTGAGREEFRDRAQSRAQRGYHAERRNNTKGILILILLVFLSPFIIGGVGGAFGVIAAIIMIPFSLIFAFGAAAVAMLAGAVACIGVGISLCAGNPAAGLLTIGIGCILMAVGLVFMVLTAGTAGRLLPWLLRKITDTCGRILNRVRDRKEGVRQ